MIHAMADVQSDQIGPDTRIWQYSIVLPGAVIGAGCNVNAHCLIEGGARLGDRVTIKCGVYVWNGVNLADDVFVGPNATFTNDLHPRSRRPPAQWVPTVVQRGASIGPAATIVAGVTMGEYALVGAGSVVTRDVGAYRVVVGVPARPQGWICRCAERLGESLVCGACGRRYVRRGDGLAPLEPTEPAS